MSSHRRLRPPLLALACATVLAVAVPALPALADPPAGWKFDFGTATSPVAAGYTQITEANRYSAGAGFGISTDGTLISRYRGTDGTVVPIDALKNDFVAAAAWSFLVDVPNGTYDVRVLSGDELPGTSRTNTSVTLEGATAGSISTLRAVSEQTWRTTVADGQLTVGIGGNGYINGIEVTPVVTTPEPTDPPTDPTDPPTDPTDPPTTTPTDPTYGTIASPTSLRTAHVIDGSVTLRWNEITGATGYILSRSDAVDGTFTTVATVGDAVWATDASADTSDVNYYRVQAIGADGPSVPSAVAVATLAGDGVAPVTLPANGVLSFDLGSGDTAPGAIHLDATSAYTAEQRYGVVDVSKVAATDRATGDSVRGDFVTIGDTELVVDLPNGDYTVGLIAGDATDTSEIAITAEQMAKVQTTAKTAGQYLEMSFDIAIVDGQLNLEFAGTAPKLNQLVITQKSERTAGAKPTVWVTGDSTVQSYTADYAPQAGWGQMLGRYLDDNVTVDNRAIGGRSAKNFISQGRLDEVLREVRPGDYLFVQFGHNDNSRGVDDRWAAPADYRNYLRTFVDGAIQRGATPILVTAVSRRSFDATTGQFNVSFPDYVDAAKSLAVETDTSLVDLSASSRAYLNEIGPEQAKSVFLHVPAGVYPGRPSGTVDDTHFQEYGAIQLARLVATDVAGLNIPLAGNVVQVAPPTSPPLAPAGVLAGSISDSSAQLTWTAVEGADIYKVYVKAAGADDSTYRLATSSTLPQALVTGLTRGESYEVYVVATNGAGDSERSSLVSITTKAPLWSFDFQLQGNVVEPGYLEVNQNTLYTPALKYGWTALPGPGGRDRGTNFTPPPTALSRDFLLPGTGNTFVVDVPIGTYSVTAYSGDHSGTAQMGAVIEGVDYGTGRTGRNGIATKIMQPVAVTDGQLTMVSTGWLNGLEITPLQYAPSGLTLADVRITDAVEVDLTWTGAEGANAYRIYRQAQGATAPTAIGESTEASYTDTSADVGQAYTYKVVALDAAGTESLSTELAVTTVDEDIETAAVPSGLAVTAVEKNLVSLAWDEVDGALFYHVYRSKTADGTFELVGRADEATFTDTDVLTTISYYYKVASVNAGGVSEHSDAVASDAVTTLVRQAENLGRAPVAVKTDEGVYIGWRLLGLDPQNLGFHVYRDGARVTSTPITGSTNVLDPAGTTDSTYRIATVVGGVQKWVTPSFSVWDDQTFDVALDKPADAYTKDGQPYSYRAGDASIGDVDGDGEYEIILKWDPSNAKDNSQAGYTGNVYIDAYKLDGTRLWRIDLGNNIRAGAHYTQFQVFDYDGNGKAEIIMKTADGTVDGIGAVIGDARADYRNSGGYVLTGPEYLTVFNGETGAAIDTINYTPPRGDVGSWGDAYGNRVDRFLAATAYLDGEKPSVVVTRGYYTRTVAAAYDFDGSQLVQRWVFDTNDPAVGEPYMHQGNHNLSIADVDGDQKDEIVFGSMTIDDDGKPLYTTGLGHGDAMHVSNFDPSREGLEVFSVHEAPGGNGNQIATFRDAGTGEILWNVSGVRDTGRGAAGDIDPRFPGAEAWNIADGGAWNSPSGVIHSAAGELISESIPAANFVTWWDGDLLREITDHAWTEETRTGVPTISKWDWENERAVEIYRADGTLTVNDTKGNPSLQADLFGDWREEIVTRTDDSTALRIATTVDLTDHRLRTLQSDPVYRLGVAWQNTAYNQPPHTSYFLGEGMATPAAPSISYVGASLETPEIVKPSVVITSGGGEVTQAQAINVTGTASPGDTGWKENKAVVYAELQNASGAKVVGRSVNVIDGAWSTSFDTAALPVGTYTIKVSASSKGQGNGSDTERVIVKAARVPGPATGAPAAGVLSHNNWDGDGDFDVTFNMWWGQNGWSVDLYENGALLASKELRDATPSAQSASFSVTGRVNGSYAYTAVLTNQHGQTTTAVLNVPVTTANPGVPVLSHDNWDGDGRYTVTMNMWWGTNATTYRLYRDGVLVDTQQLTPNGRNAQRAVTLVTGAAPGSAVYTAVLSNAQGSTSSAPVTVSVVRP